MARETTVRSLRTCILTLLALALGSPAGARPNIRLSFFNSYPSAAGSRLDNLPSITGHCGVCHYAFTGGGPRNPYGASLEAVIPNYPNNDSGRQQAIHSVENLDSDADGYSQLVEVTDTAHFVNTPTFPGLTPANVGQVTGVNVNEILPYLVPSTGADTTPPSITVTAPNGGESWTGGTTHPITWTASDNVGVSSVDLYYRDGATAPWTTLALGLANSGSFSWPVHNTPTTGARVRAVARDAAGNTAEDMSNANFTILRDATGIAPTTLRDFHQPGTQPFGGGSFQDRTACSGCHGGYDPAVEPDRNFRGSMMAQAGRDPIFFACLAIAEQDAPSSGDLCLRCHSGIGWFAGRSNPTDGSGLVGADFDGVTCDICHRLVDPVYTPGTDPAEDQAILSGLAPSDLPLTYSNGQMVMDPQPRKRGPFADAAPPHAFLVSPFHRSSDICGTCHDVSNPVFRRTGEFDYTPGPFDQKADTIASNRLMPLERTYSEWKNSAFPAGVYAPEFAGNRPDGMVSTCVDCHLHDVAGKGCNDPNAPLRQDLPLHDMTGGNTWMPGIVAQEYPGEVDPAALAAGALRAADMLHKAASVDLTVTAEGDSFRADVLVTNRTGHKLPTGYPEGRRVFVNLKAFDANGQKVFESGAYDPGTGILAQDPALTVYGAELGLSPSLASALGLSGGPSFHFALNDSMYKDNRIPPMGFTRSAFLEFGGAPVDSEHPGPRYADGQYWDTPSYHLPANALHVIATLYYQTTSKGYVEFLRDQNTSNGTGQLMYDLWSGNGRAAPVAMVADSVLVAPSGLPDPVAPRALGLAATPNPSRGEVRFRIDLPEPAQIRLEVFDASGRSVRAFTPKLAAGTHAISWNGRSDSGAETANGLYWVRLDAGERSIVRRVVRMK